MLISFLCQELWVIQFYQVLYENYLETEMSDRLQICDALRDLVIFIQFKKREKHLWRSVNFSKVAGFSLQLY